MNDLSTRFEVPAADVDGGTVTAPPPTAGARRWLFVLTILTGSFLLFLVQPMVARMALPRLGGAPNVWNSAMLVYQALLLGGYGYAHLLGKLALRRQVMVHLAALVLAGLTLPVGLVALPPAEPGMEVLWVPLLLVLSIGPVFFVMSAQAPLMQRWFAADPRASDPWALYAASNLGSFAGLLAYPLLAEPLLSLHQQSLGWTMGFAVLVMLVAAAGASRRAPAALAAAPASQAQAQAVPQQAVGWRTIAMWLMLSAVPSGLMLSTTTHLTTDIFAMPLLWVIPLGLYLLSFVFAFVEGRRAARVISLLAPTALLAAGGLAMVSQGGHALTMALASTGLLFVLAVALHARLYDLRPDTSRLTLFYLVMSAGGALGGAFTALVAPVVFDWTWEHPLLVLAAAMLIPAQPMLDWRRVPKLSPQTGRLAVVALAAVAVVALSVDLGELIKPEATMAMLGLGVLVCLAGTLLFPIRPAYVLVLAGLMVVQGGITTIAESWHGARTRSYFGIYKVQNDPQRHVRTLSHGTTLHGLQSTLPGSRLEPTTYYGDTAGVGMALDAVPALYGPDARIGIVGLGAGTLACRHKPGQRWTIFEIDPVIRDFSRNGDFTFLRDCAPDAKVSIGDARLDIEKLPSDSFDTLVIDAFSSDSIPLHLLTSEAMASYERVLAPHGLLVFHMTNRYFDLEPVLAALARDRGLHARLRVDDQPAGSLRSSSEWVLLSRDPKVLDAVARSRPNAPLRALHGGKGRVWTDDFASVLPYIRWRSIAALQ